MQNENFLAIFKPWLEDGGKPTAEAFLALPDEEKKKVLYYLSVFGIYEEVEAGGKRFFLAHTVPEKEKMENLAALKTYDFLTGEPDYDKVYYPDKYVVTGHTPTGLISLGCRGILQWNNHIAIDCGAVFGKRLGCIRLDDLEEFYVE